MESSLKNRAFQLNESNLSIVPISILDKYPKMLSGWKKYEQQKPTTEEISSWFTKWISTNKYGIGIVCGSVSGGLEVIDFDNHLGNIEEIFSEYIRLKEVAGVIKKHSLPYEKSPSGGYHLFYRCSEVDGNKKLATGLKDDKKACMIETRGEGGLIVTSPTKGYTLLEGDLCQINEISVQERNILISYAKAFNQIPAKSPSTNRSMHNQNEVYSRPTDGTTSWEYYNQQSYSLNEVKQLLNSNGWTSFNRGNIEYWKRPGKKHGISATFGSVADNIFYVFTSNASPFDPDTAYTPFQILSLLKYNGDFKTCASELSANNAPSMSINDSSKEITKANKVTNNAKSTHQQNQPTKEEKSIIELLKTAKIDFNEPLLPPPAALKIKNNIDDYSLLGTMGNFAAIIGKAKSRKTFLVTVATAAAINGKVLLDKVEGCLPENQNKVIYFDTEQSKYHVQKLSHRIIRLLDNSPSDLKNLDVYCLRPLATFKRLEMVEFLIENTANLGLVVIDGIRDLIRDINSPDEATMISDKLLEWTEKYNICILVVLHQNKGDGHARGHLGTEIINKAESTISVTKSKGDKNVSVVEAEFVRNKEFESFAFSIDEEGLPYICEIPDENSEKQQKVLTPDSLPMDWHIEILQKIFKNHKTLSAGDLRGLTKQEFQNKDIQLGDNKARIFNEYQLTKGIIRNISNVKTKKEYILEDKYLIQHQTM